MSASPSSLLAESVRYALGNAELVTPDLLSRPTPCREWNLRMLLWHACESLGALAEASTSGYVPLTSAPAGVAAREPVGLFAGRARGLLATWGCPDEADVAAGDRPRPVVAVGDRPRPAVAVGDRPRPMVAVGDRPRPVVMIGDRQLTADLVAAVGALEIAVHGWDVAQASGSRLPIPPRLAASLLELAPLLVTDGERPQLFGARVTVGCEASASEKLTAFLGRTAPTSAAT